MINTLESSPSQDHVPGLLRSFFKREMPDPWPDVKLPVANGDAFPRGSVGGQSWFRPFSRLALVAAVGFILLSYLSLAEKFPASPEPGLTLERDRMIGSVPTPRGGRALLWEERMPTGPGQRPTIVISVKQITAPEKR